MSSPAEQPVSSPAGASAPPHHRPWGWIAICGLLVVVAAGLAIWAFGLQSDLDDQRDQTAQAQQQAQQATEQASALSDQVDQISQKVSDAGAQLSQAGADAKQNAQQALDGLQSDLDSLKSRVEEGLDRASAASP